MRRRKSISSRVFLGLFVFGFGILTLAGAGLYLRVRTMLFAALDEDLESDLDVFTGLLVLEEGRLAFQPANMVDGPFSIPRSGHYYQIWMEDRGLVGSISLAGAHLDLDAARRVRRDEAAALSVYNSTGPAGEPLRVMERSVVFGGRPAQIVVAHSMRTAAEMLRKLGRFLALLGLLGAFGGGLLGWAISRRSLRPLRDFSDRVRGIREPGAAARFDPAELHDELASLAEAFNDMLDRLRRSFQAREELLSDVSHELKTPIAVIRSHCDIYLQRHREPAEYAEALRVIRETADGMNEKIRRLLASAQSAADRLEASSMRPVDLIECLRQARLLHEGAAREKGVDIREALPSRLSVPGRPDRLIEAFSCLLDNAVKYTAAGGTVTIAAEPAADAVEVRIEDTGPGMNETERDRVFDRLYRGSTADATEGAGIGLYLVKSIVEAHGGSVTVRSAVGQGSVFAVILPSDGGDPQAAGRREPLTWVP